MKSPESIRKPGVQPRAADDRLVQSQDLSIPAERAFAVLCEIENWPRWLSFVRSARRVEDTGDLRTGSEIGMHSAITGGDEEIFEVEHFISGHVLSLVGAYSLRRRIDFRVEGLGSRSRLVVGIDYPAYGGALGALFDRLVNRPRLGRALAASLIHFQNLVEADAPVDDLLADY